MRLQESHVLRLVLILGLILLVGISSQPVLAQEPLVVESASVENGDTNVPVLSDYRITFSAPISTIGLPEIGLDDLPIDLELDFGDCEPTPALVLFAPEGCQEDWRLEDNGRTLVLENVTISEDQVTTLIVLFAVGADGAVLERPFAIRFTASDMIDQGSISGVVSSADLDPAGAIVALAPSSVVDLTLSEDSLAIDPVLAFADGDGNYEAVFVPDEEYAVIGLQLDLAAIADVLGAAAKVDLQGVGIGSHDEDGDGFIDYATVESGAAVSGIDVTLFSSGFTVGEADALALAEIVSGGASTARLSFAAGLPLEDDGTSLAWVLLYTDLFTGGGWLSASLGQLQFPPEDVSGNPDLAEILIIFATAMFTDYADSDQAVDWFRQNGGEEFFAQNPGAVGFGMLLDRQLFDLLLEILKGGAIGFPFMAGLEPWGEVLSTGPVASAIRSTLSKQQALEAWIVGFLGTESELGLHLVAMAADGSPLLVIGSSKASANKANADIAASAWDPGASLISIGTMDLPVSDNGSALAWSYDYYSPSRDSVLSIVVSGGLNGTVLTQTVIPHDQVPSTEGLTDDWIDSDQAISAADEVAADFLGSHVGVTSSAILTKGLHSDNPGLAIWRVTYTGGTEEGTTETRIVDIDAATGVSVSTDEDRVVPGSFALGQNYPNPFNPETVIPFEIRESGPVKLSVFNALGQEIRVLVDGVRSEGTYRVRWDASDGAGRAMPSGLYLYRLEAGDRIESRRMLLLR